LSSHRSQTRKRGSKRTPQKEKLKEREATSEILCPRKQRQIGVWKGKVGYRALKHSSQILLVAGDRGREVSSKGAKSFTELKENTAGILGRENGGSLSSEYICGRTPKRLAECGKRGSGKNKMREPREHEEGRVRKSLSTKKNKLGIIKI